MLSPRPNQRQNIPSTKSSMSIDQATHSMSKLIGAPIHTSQSTRQLPQAAPQRNQSILLEKEKEDSQKKKQMDASNSKKSPDPDPEIVQISQDLIAGDIDSASIDSSKISEVNLYLRKYKRTVLQEPDYFTAQRIDDVCSELSLLSTQNTYCNYRTTEIKTVTEHLKKAKSELQKTLDERKKVQGTFEDQKAKRIEKLQQQQQKELEALDEKYNGEIPPRYKKLSSEVLNIKRQETQLKNAKMYLEAQRLKEEADALEAFELARQEVRFHNEGVENREKLLLTHRNQMNCLLENLERQYMTMMPSSYAEEKHWKQVISQYERQLKKLKGDSREVKKATNTILSDQSSNSNTTSTPISTSNFYINSNVNNTKNSDVTNNDSNNQTNNKDRVTATKQGSKGLPSLGKKVPQTPMTRVLKMNNKRTYSRFGVRRPKSSAF